MRIEKEYNLQELANKVKEEIGNYERGTKRVGLDIITAQAIVDVLETVASWENKRTKLRDIREEVLKEVSLRECFGHCVEDDYMCTHCVNYEECRKEIEDDETEDFV